MLGYNLQGRAGEMVRKKWLIITALVLALLAVTFREGLLITILRLPVKIHNLREG